MSERWSIVYFAGLRFISCAKTFDSERTACAFAVSELPHTSRIIVEQWRVKTLLLALSGTREELENLSEAKDTQPDTVRRVEEISGTKVSYWK